MYEALCGELIGDAGIGNVLLLIDHADLLPILDATSSDCFSWRRPTRLSAKCNPRTVGLNLIPHSY